MSWGEKKQSLAYFKNWLRPVWLNRKQEENAEDEFGETGKAEILQFFVGSSKETEFYFKSNGKHWSV